MHPRPDPAPRGVDVTKRRSVRDMVATSGDVVGPADVPCIGDGTSGPRVQAIYAVASDKADRYASVKDLIAGWAGAMDAAVNDSAKAMGGERHIRFVTNADCSLHLTRVVLSPVGDDSFSATVSSSRPPATHAPTASTCSGSTRPCIAGFSQVRGGRQRGRHQPQQHPNRLWPCRHRLLGPDDHLSELHELFHTLGGVQPSAPHGTRASTAPTSTTRCATRTPPR